MGGWVSSPLITLENDETKYPLELESKTIVSHDTRKFRFKLPSENHVLGLPPGLCAYLSARVYFAGVDPKFPDGGKMSQHLDKMEIGEKIDFRGPSGLIVYHGLGSFAVKKNKKSKADMRKFDKISKVAGGSGITPMLQNSSKSKVDRSTKANKSCQPSKSKINSEKTQKDSSIDKSAPKKYEPTTRKKKEPKKLIDDVATPVAPAKPSKMKVTPMPKSLAVADKGNTVNSKASTFRLLPRPDECWRYSDEFRESQLKLLEKIRARQKATGDYTPRLLDRNYD